MMILLFNNLKKQTKHNLMKGLRNHFSDLETTLMGRNRLLFKAILFNLPLILNINVLFSGIKLLDNIYF